MLMAEYEVLAGCRNEGRSSAKIVSKQTLV